MPYSDRWRQQRASQDHYLRHRERRIATAADWTARQRSFLRGYVIKAKEGVPCAECGIEYPHYKLTFDHVRGKKRGNVADMVSAGVSLRTIRMEIAKCEIVCANCHAGRNLVAAANRDAGGRRSARRGSAPLRLTPSALAFHPVNL